MGASHYVEGIKPADEKYTQMRQIWKACQTAKVEIPKEVVKFFGGDPPDDKGVVTALWAEYPSCPPGNHPAVACGEQIGTQFWDVDLSKLDKDIKIVRFIIRY